jgi:uncharacterized protein DUF3592
MGLLDRLRSTSSLDRLPEIIGLWPARSLVFLGVYGILLMAAIAILTPSWVLHLRGAHTVGTVLAKEPQNHLSIKYRFQVAATTYEGESGPWDLSVTNVGDSVPITYLPSDPKLSMAGEPNLRGWWFLPFVLLPLGAAFAAIGGVRRKKTAA